MTGVKRKNFTGDLKAKVALEAIRGIKTVNEIGQEFGVHPTQVGLSYFPQLIPVKLPQTYFW
ncbi:MAG: transposase [Nitrosomonas sp.]|nr:transposase [Nitrosomonas sp.]